MRVLKIVIALLKRGYIAFGDTILQGVESLKDGWWCLFWRFMYRVGGECKQCGKCCRHVYLRVGGRVMKTFDDCLDMAKEQTALNSFTSKGQGDGGALFFGCRYVTKDNTCGKYDDRPAMCRAYPDVNMLRYEAVPKDDCGFYFVNRITGKKVEFPDYEE